MAEVPAREASSSSYKRASSTESPNRIHPFLSESCSTPFFLIIPYLSSICQANKKPVLNNLKQTKSPTFVRDFAFST